MFNLEALSAAIFRASAMCREVKSKLWYADSQKSLRRHCITTWLREVPLLWEASVTLLSE